MKDEITLSVEQLEMFSDYENEDLDTNTVSDNDGVLKDFVGWTFSSDYELGTINLEKSATYDYPIQIESPDGIIYKGTGGWYHQGHNWDEPITLTRYEKRPAKPKLKDLILIKLDAMELDSFEDWHDEAKAGYLTAVGTIKEFINKH